MVPELSRCTGISFNNLKVVEVPKVYCVVLELSSCTGTVFPLMILNLWKDQGRVLFVV